MNVRKTLHIFLLMAISDSARFLVSSERTEIKFLPNVLQPDLNAIAQYFKMNNNEKISAYIHWPDSITYSVANTVESNEQYLKIDGTFKMKMLSCINCTYVGLYYKDDQFYVRSQRKSTLKPISSSASIIYSQPSIRESKPYLSIRYFGLDEMFEEIKANFLKHRMNYEHVLYKYPATFLVTLAYPEGHVLEYTYRSNQEGLTAADGKLRALIGHDELGKFKVKKNIETSKLVFNQYDYIDKKADSAKKLLISDGYRHIFGLRMATVGFLSVVRESSVTLLSIEDLSSEPNPNKNRITVQKLVEKIRLVEPRLNYPGLNFWTRSMPKRVKFQVQGVILVKRRNFLLPRNPDPACPHVIEFDKEGQSFSVRFQQVTSFCTDDSELWVKDEDNRRFYDPSETILLVSEH